MSPVPLWFWVLLALLVIVGECLHWWATHPNPKRRYRVVMDYHPFNLFYVEIDGSRRNVVYRCNFWRAWRTARHHVARFSLGAARIDWRPYAER